MNDNAGAEEVSIGLLHAAAAYLVRFWLHRAQHFKNVEEWGRIFNASGKSLMHTIHTTPPAPSAMIRLATECN